MTKIRTLIEGIFQLLLLPIFYLPGPAGNALRYRYWKRRLKHLGKGVIIDIGVHIQNPQYVSIDDNTWIDKYVILIAGPPNGKRETLVKKNPNFLLKAGELFIGKNCHIGAFTIISAIGGVHIQNDVTFSAGCRVYSFTHHYRSFAHPHDSSFGFGSRIDENRQCMLLGPIVFEENVGVALGCIVLPGVTVAKNSFILINSVVTKDIPPNSLAAGNPAQVIGERFITSRVANCADKKS